MVGRRSAARAPGVTAVHEKIMSTSLRIMVKLLTMRDRGDHAAADDVADFPSSPGRAIRAPAVDRDAPATVAPASEDIDSLAGVASHRTGFPVGVGRLVRVALECPRATDHEADRRFLPMSAGRSEIVSQPLAHR